LENEKHGIIVSTNKVEKEILNLENEVEKMYREAEDNEKNHKKHKDNHVFNVSDSKRKFLEIRDKIEERRKAIKNYQAENRKLIKFQNQGKNRQ